MQRRVLLLPVHAVRAAAAFLLHHPGSARPGQRLLELPHELEQGPKKSVMQIEPL